MLDDNYGNCCVCEEKITDALANIFQMDYKVPVPSGTNPETGWGCFVCNLPMEGAVAVVCETCIRVYGEVSVWDQIKFLMDGRDRRIPVPPVEERIHHDHDYSKHPECVKEIIREVSEI